MMDFLRCRPDHHSMAIFRNNGPSLNHVAYEVPNMDGLMRGSGRLKQNGFNVEWGIGRHGPGNNVLSYFIEPNGFVTEYTTEVEQVDEASHIRRRRILGPAAEQAGPLGSRGSAVKPHATCHVGRALRRASPERSAARTSSAASSAEVSRVRICGRPECRPTETPEHVRFGGPTADIQSLLDHLVGAAEQYRRHFQPDRLRRLEIDHQLELGRLLDGQLARIRSFENLVDVYCEPLE